MQIPSSIEGIHLHNPVAKNSHGGHISTDEAPWSFQTAKDAGKSHGLCCKHKATGIVKSHSGLRGLFQSNMNDMNEIIYNIFQSKASWITKSEKLERSIVIIQDYLSSLTVLTAINICSARPLCNMFSQLDIAPHQLERAGMQE